MNCAAYLEKKVFFQKASEDQFKIKPRMPTYPDRSNPNARFEEQLEVSDSHLPPQISLYALRETPSSLRAQ
jgi:hypothetical protein